MMQLSLEEISGCIRNCGLSSSKSKHIKRLSAILVREHNGRVPSDIRTLEGLPGTGHKTAGVVVVQAFGIPDFPVDTHIHRLAQHWKLTAGKDIGQTEADIKKPFPKKNWRKLHLQMICYDREHGTSSGCNGAKCEICRTSFPPRKKPVIIHKA